MVITTYFVVFYGPIVWFIVNGFCKKTMEGSKRKSLTIESFTSDTYLFRVRYWDVSWMPEKISQKGTNYFIRNPLWDYLFSISRFLSFGLGKLSLIPWRLSSFFYTTTSESFTTEGDHPVEYPGGIWCIITLIFRDYNPWSFLDGRSWEQLCRYLDWSHPQWRRDVKMVIESYVSLE